MLQAGCAAGPLHRVDAPPIALPRDAKNIPCSVHSAGGVGCRVRIWTDIRGHCRVRRFEVLLKDLVARMDAAAPIVTTVIPDPPVLTSVVDAPMRSIFGGGLTARTVGVLDGMNQRECGLAGIIFQADQLSDHYGERFRPPASLVARAATGELYE